jgi:hypothetical protein
VFAVADGHSHRQPIAIANRGPRIAILLRQLHMMVGILSAGPADDNLCF